MPGKNFLLMIVLLCVLVKSQDFIDFDTPHLRFDDTCVVYDWGKLPESGNDIYVIRDTLDTLLSRNDDLSFYIPPSPYPMEVVFNDILLYRFGDLEKSNTLAQFSPVHMSLSSHHFRPEG
ncbi:MAG: hypothetical protein ACQEQ4_11085, partial [Fibrobacterota bacterium]